MQEARLTEEKKHLLEMQEALQEKKKDLEDPSVIEKRQGKIWGLSRNGRSPISSKFSCRYFTDFITVCIALLMKFRIMVDILFYVLQEGYLFLHGFRSRKYR